VTQGAIRRVLGPVVINENTMMLSPYHVGGGELSQRPTAVRVPWWWWWWHAGKQWVAVSSVVQLTDLSVCLPALPMVGPADLHWQHSSDSCSQSSVNQFKLNQLYKTCVLLDVMYRYYSFTFIVCLWSLLLISESFIPDMSDELRPSKKKLRQSLSFKCSWSIYIWVMCFSMKPVLLE